MNRSTRRAAVAALAAAAISIPASASANVVLTATAVAGTLSVAGAGTATGNAAPGAWTTLTGATVVTVSDLRGSTAGWHVSAQYTAPVTGNSLGGANVRVSTTSPTGDALTNLKTYSGVTLGSAATILSTYGAGSTALSGAGISAATAGFDVYLPTTAQLTDVYSGTVVFTVSTG